MKIKKGLILLAILVAAYLVFVNIRQDRWLTSNTQTFLDKILDPVVAPVQKSLTSVTGFFSGLWHDYFNLVGVNKENEELKKEIAFKDLKILSLEQRLYEKGQREELDTLTQVLQVRGIPAKVIAFDPFAVSKTVKISAGSIEGVLMNSAVIAPEGLVGRVIKVFPHTSLVLLLVDSRFSVDVIDQSTNRVRALVVGNSQNATVTRYPFLTHLEYLKLGDEMFPGDLLVTSGLSEIYPYGIPVGHVLRVEKDEDNLFQNSMVIPTVDISKIKEVTIILKDPIE